MVRYSTVQYSTVRYGTVQYQYSSLFFRLDFSFLTKDFFVHTMKKVYNKYISSHTTGTVIYDFEKNYISSTVLLHN